MSLEAARNFTARLIEDPKIAGELATAIAGKSPAEKATVAAQMATRLGYDSTAEEMREVRDAVVRVMSEPVPAPKGELSDEQLQAVSGGITAAQWGGKVGGYIASWLTGKGSLSGGVMTVTGVALGGPALGPGGLAVAAVGGGLNAVDQNPQAASMGVSSQSIGQKIGSEIGSFFSDAFSGW
jgi:hypothetical protein